MDTQSERFDQMRRLLAVKRHEVPPPGFFDGFSGQVLARIEAGERGQDVTFFQRLLAEPLWFQRLLAAFDAKPAIAGAFGLAVCGVLVAGVFHAERTDGPTAAVLPPVEAMPGALQVANWMQVSPEQRERTAAVQLPSTDPAAPNTSLFKTIQQYRLAQPPLLIDYQPPGR